MSLLSGTIEYREKIVHTISWLGLAYGVLYLVNILFMFGTYLFTTSYLTKELGLSDVPSPLSLIPDKFIYTLAYLIFGRFAITLGLITSSIGMLKSKEWARSLAVKVMAAFVIFGIANFFLVNNLISEQHTNTINDMPIISLMNSMSKFNLLTGCILNIIVPSFIGFLLYREDYREVFSQ